MFYTERTNQITHWWATHRFKESARDANLDERISFHSLRHTCASRMVMRGVPLPVVQRVLRHSSISVTEGYAHLAPEVVRSHMETAFDDQQAADDQQQGDDVPEEETQNEATM